MMCGGFNNNPREPDENSIEATNSVKSLVEERLSKVFETFELHSFKSQVVAGINYKLKVKVGEKEFLHLFVFKQLPHQGGGFVLNNIVEGQSETDELN